MKTGSCAGQGQPDHGNLYQTKTLVFDDDNRQSSITHGQNTDVCIYDWQGRRTRTQLNGGWHRYLYDVKGCCNT